MQCPVDRLVSAGVDVWDATANFYPWLSADRASHKRLGVDHESLEVETPFDINRTLPNRNARTLEHRFSKEVNRLRLHIKVC
jgi:hypothetical protein